MWRLTGPQTERSYVTSGAGLGETRHAKVALPNPEIGEPGNSFCRHLVQAEGDRRAGSRGCYFGEEIQFLRRYLLNVHHNPPKVSGECGARKVAVAKSKAGPSPATHAPEAALVIVQQRGQVL